MAEMQNVCLDYFPCLEKIYKLVKHVGGNACIQWHAPRISWLEIIHFLCYLDHSEKFKRIYDYILRLKLHCYDFICSYLFVHVST